MGIYSIVSIKHQKRVSDDRESNMIQSYQTAAIVLGLTIGSTAMASMAYDAYTILKTTKRMNVAIAYAISTTCAIIGFVILTCLVAIGNKAPMPLFAIVYAGFAGFWTLHAWKSTQVVRFLAFLFAFTLYWNVSSGESKLMIGAATPPLIVHAGFTTLIIRQRT